MPPLHRVVEGTPRPPQEQQVNEGARSALMNHLPGVNTLKNVAKVTGAILLIYGAYSAFEGISHELGNFGIHLDIGGTTPPDSSANVHSDTFTSAVINVTCPDAVSFDVGVRSSEQVDWVSGINHDHLLPVREPVCGPNGFIANEKKYKDKAGNVVKVVVDEPFYSPQNARIDFNNGGVICEGLSSTATKAQIDVAETSYNKAKAKGQNIHCDFRHNTTGAGFASVNDGDIQLTADYVAAQNAASLSPIPAKVQNQIDQDIKRAAVSQVSANFPGAEVIVQPPRFNTTLSQIEHNWLVNSGDITNDANRSSIKAQKSGNQLEFDENLIYDGAKIKYFVPANLSDIQIGELNAFIHNPNNTVPIPK